MDDNSAPPGDSSSDIELSITSLRTQPREDGSLDVELRTTRGDIACVLHPSEGSPAAAMFVGGALGGIAGPANGVYKRLAQDFAGPGGGISSLRLGYREPGEFTECVLDVLAGLSFLTGIGARRVTLTGHSFGGAVAIKAAELSDAVTGVAALSPQLYGTRAVERVSPRPLLLVHGTADTVLDCAASSDIFDRAREPKRLVLYEGAGHGLDSCSEELFELLREFLSQTALGPAHV